MFPPRRIPQVERVHGFAKYSTPSRTHSPLRFRIRRILDDDTPRANRVVSSMGTMLVTTRSSESFGRGGVVRTQQEVVAAPTSSAGVRALRLELRFESRARGPGWLMTPETSFHAEIDAQRRYTRVPQRFRIAVWRWSISLAIKHTRRSAERAIVTSTTIPVRLSGRGGGYRLAGTRRKRGRPSRRQ